MTGRTHPDWPICRFRVSDRSAKCGYKVRNRWADVICDEDGCPIEEVQVDTMKCKQYGRCSNFDDTECSGEDGSTPIACSHFSKIDLTTISTLDLVRELCSRDNVSALQLSAGESCGEPRPRIHGPSLVIVVRGDER